MARKRLNKRQQETVDTIISGLDSLILDYYGFKQREKKLKNEVSSCNTAIKTAIKDYPSGQDEWQKTVSQGGVEITAKLGTRKSIIINQELAIEAVKRNCENPEDFIITRHEVPKDVLENLIETGVIPEADAIGFLTEKKTEVLTIK